MENQKRNLNPTLEAKIAMIIWSKAYSEQGGGSMDFWDNLSETKKTLCWRIAQVLTEKSGGIKELAHKTG